MSITGRLLRVLAWIYGIYLALCLLVLLPALNVLAPRIVKEQSGRDLRSEIILFNPFNLALELRGATVTEPDGHQPLAVKRVLVDLSLESLWSPGVVFDRLWVDELDLHVLRYADGSFHFEDLLTESAPPEVEDDAPAFPVTLQDLRIDAHTLTYTDRTRPGPYVTVHRDFGLQTRNLTTVPGREGDGFLELTSDGGGMLRWQGDVTLGDGLSAGRLQLENIDLRPIWRYERDNLAFVLERARLDLDLTYRAAWSAETQVEVSDGRLALHDIDIRPAEPQRLPDTAIRLGNLSLSGLHLDLAQSRAGADSLDVTGLEVDGFDEGETISLQELLLGPAQEGDDAAPPDPDTATAASAEESDPGPWSVRLERFALGDSRVRWRTPYLAPEQMVIEPLRISAQALAWPAQERSPFDLELAVNGQANLSLGGALNTDSGSGEAQLALDGWELAWLHPLIHEQARTDLERGTLSLQSTALLENFEPQRVNAEVLIDDFGTVLHETGEEAFSLEQFALEGVSVEPPDQLVRIDRLRLERPAGSLHILEDGSINVNGILREGPEAPEPESAPGDAEPWRVLLAQAVLAGGRLDFADDSLPLPFRATIEDIEAEVRDVDTAAETPLTVTLNGNVDGYAPVIIEGSGTPHGAQSDGRVRFRFRGVDIATMSPYSGTYAGYTIDSGTLTLDLTYALAGTTIEGDNRIVISQMQLGEPVNSDLAVEVPLKLGIALLTDARGVIDLSVPVSGDVDDPEFSLGAVIGRAVMNVITKAVTAPFRLLAGLVDSEADLENIAFDAGADALTVDGESGLEALAEALTQRPQLALRIVGATDPATDGPVLREAALGAALLAEGLAATSLETRDEAWASVVEARFAAAFPAPAESEGADSEGADAAPPTLEEKWDALVALEPLTPTALQDLGTARAAEAKRELVTIGGIDAARIAISYAGDRVFQGVHMELDG